MRLPTAEPQCPIPLLAVLGSMLTQDDQSKDIIIPIIVVNVEVDKWPEQAHRGCQRLALHNPAGLPALQ